MSPFQQKLAYQRQITALHNKVSRINDRAERDQGLRLVRYLGKIGATFGISEAHAFHVAGSVELPDQHGNGGSKVEDRIGKLMGWSGYHERFNMTLPARNPKRPHYFSFNVDDGHYTFSFSFNRPQAGKLDRQLTEEEKNDTFFVRFLDRFCRKNGIKIELWRFERELKDAEDKANEKRANLTRLQSALA